MIAVIFPAIKHSAKTAVSKPCDCVHYFHTLLGERAWKEANALQTVGIHCKYRGVLPNTTTGQEEGGDFTRPIQVETMGEKKRLCKPL